jgi:hypothetical protein
MNFSKIVAFKATTRKNTSIHMLIWNTFFLSMSKGVHWISACFVLTDTWHLHEAKKLQKTDQRSEISVLKRNEKRELKKINTSISPENAHKKTI